MAGVVTVALRASGEAAGPGEFLVPSASMPGEHWTVVYQGPETVWCPCIPHARHGTCKHVQAVALAVEIEAREAVARSTPETRARAAARLAQIEQEFAR